MAIVNCKAKMAEDTAKLKCSSQNVLLNHSPTLRAYRPKQTQYRIFSCIAEPCTICHYRISNLIKICTVDWSWIFNCRQADDTVFQLSIGCDFLSPDVVSRFAEAHRLPPVAVYSRETWRLIAASHVTDHVLLFVEPASLSDGVASEFRRAAETYHGLVSDQ